MKAVIKKRFLLLEKHEWTIQFADHKVSINHKQINNKHFSISIASQSVGLINPVYTQTVLFFSLHNLHSTQFSDRKCNIIAFKKLRTKGKYIQSLKTFQLKCTLMESSILIHPQKICIAFDIIQKNAFQSIEKYCAQQMNVKKKEKIATDCIRNM